MPPWAKMMAPALARLGAGLKVPGENVALIIGGLFLEKFEVAIVGTGDSKMKTGHRVLSTAQVPACEIEEYFLEVAVVGFQASQKHALAGELGGEGGN